MKYYEITKAEADQIGKRRINDYMAIDPYAGRLKNGNYIIKEDVAQWVKDDKTISDKVNSIIKTKTSKVIPKSDLDIPDILKNP